VEELQEQIILAAVEKEDQAQVYQQMEEVVEDVVVEKGQQVFYVEVVELEVPVMDQD
jgi:hypothetical protein